jgi:cell division septum initiation protein DivIVA
MTLTFGSLDRLTPDRVESIAFQQTRLGRRGLDEEQVRAFCVHVHHELVRLLNEKAALYEETQRLRGRLEESGDQAGAAGPARSEDAHVLAVRILSKAQQTADKYVADAQRYSRQLAEDARRHRDEMLAEAHSHAARLLEEAHADATLAATAAATSAAPLTVAERKDLEAELAYLRTFSDVYRTHLRAYLEALLHTVEEWASAERSSLASTRAELPRNSLPPRQRPQADSDRQPAAPEVGHERAGRNSSQ